MADTLAESITDGAAVGHHQAFDGDLEVDMKQIKPGEFKSRVCVKCGKPAYWRSNRLSETFACQEHGELLVAMERDDAERESHLSEADYQTWMRL